jgi:non-specific serine/threonine protein kinase
MSVLSPDLQGVVDEVRAAQPHLRGADQQTWTARLDRDYDRIQQALHWLLEHDPNTGLEMAVALPDYWHNKGRWAEGRGWLEKLLSAAPNAPARLRADALSGISGMAFRQGDNETARRRAHEALAIARMSGDVRLIVGALTRLSRVRLRDQDPAQTILLCREAMDLADQTGEQELTMAPLHCMAEATRMKGDYEAARELYLRSLALNRKHADELVVSVELTNLASVELHFARVDEAKKLWREALAVAHRLQNRYLLPYPVAGLGEAAAAEQDWVRAATLLAAADGLFKASGGVMDPADVPAFEEAVARTRANLEPGAFDRAWSHGEAMIADEVVAFAG